MKDLLLKYLPGIVKNIFQKRIYTLKYEIRYRSPRYGKWVIVEKGFLSDGATGGFDVYGEAWFIHDKLCDTACWSDEDSTPVTAWQAASVLSDVLKHEGRPVRAVLWKYATFLMGCVKTRKNGWW